jgi:Transmembrane domain of unknown function (DUF3566)
MKIDLSRMAAASTGTTPKRFASRRPPRTPTPGPPRTGRPVRLRVTGVSPASVFRLWLIFAFLCLLAFLAGIFVLYIALSAMGALAAIEKAINSGGIGHHFHFSLPWILWHVGLVGSALVVLSAIVAACAAAMFGALAEATGGLEVTVTEVSPPAKAEENGQQRRHAA